ncbi:MAG: hypothetical protein QM682_07850 [Paracoccus sp. (in: a-proteobacteria)]|uniref:hypothetical protein n=1 Tax=Paracoccus sp. TaxID=267 RepID=UPI0039E487E1
MTDYPRLLPTDQLLAEPALPSHARDAAQSPDAADATLARRAAALGARGGTGPVSDAGLMRRAEALRARAADLKTRSLDDCPAEQPDCGDLGN